MDDRHHQFLITKLLPWLKNQIYKINEDKGVCIRVVLRHLKADGSSASDIHSEPVPEYTRQDNAPGPRETEFIAEEVIKAAMNDAEGLGHGVQRYGVFCYFDRNPGASTRHVMRISGGYEGDDLGTIEDTETPDARGITAQHMRHTEAMMKHSVLAMGKAIEVLAGQNEFLAKHNRDLIEKNIQTYQMVEEMTQHKHEREIELRKSEVWTRGIEDLIDKIKILTPHVVNKFAGKKLLQVDMSSEELEFMAFVETLQPNQLDNMQKVLKPEQMLALVNFLERMAKKSEKVHGGGVGSGDASIGGKALQSIGGKKNG